MKITPIADGPLDPLRRFLDRLGSSARSFRYFQSRPIEVVRNHLVTLIGIDDTGEPVAYGHLEREADVVWLGLCVAEGHTGRGLGGVMLASLMTAARDDGVKWVRLAVDMDNRPAIRLYQKWGFVPIREDGSRQFMEREVGSANIENLSQRIFKSVDQLG